MIDRKSFIIIVVTILCTILLSRVFAVDISHFAPEYGITTANVNLRNMPTTNSSSFIRTLKEGTKVKTVGSMDNFYIVQLENNEVGLVSKDYIKITGEKLDNALTYVDYSPIYVTPKTDNTNIRSGPGTNFKSYGKVTKKDKLYVIGEIDNFLLVITDKNLVGMVRSDLVDYGENTKLDSDITEETTNLEPTPESNVNPEYILSLINNVRRENNLPLLEIDSLVQSTAQTKAEDMVKNNYFSHNSPTYGTPFEMMTNAGIRYTQAGENIAGNINIDDAINSFISKDKNILSNAYNYIGIGIAPSDIYGYVIVLMFIGR